MFAFWGWPFRNSLNFNGIHLDLSIPYNDSKVFNLRLVKFTLLWFEVKFVFAKSFHYLVDMFMMSIEVVVENEDIIKVDKNMSLRDFDMEDVVHHSLEGSR